MDAVVLELQTLVTSQKPQSSDMIVWLQGDQFDRASKVLELWEQKMAPRIILTGNNALLGSDTRPGEHNFSLNEMQAWLVSRGVPDAAIMIDDQAKNTHEQAVNTLNFARKNSWRRILLVGSIHHQLRPFLTFLRRAKEINWSGRIINQPAYLEHNVIPSGRDQTVAEILCEEFKKINQYQEHVASLAEGLYYFKEKIEFEFRPASLADSELLFVWRNDPSAYQNFFSAKSVSRDEHIDWLAKTLANPNRHLYIILNQTQVIGQVRFDVEDSVAEISITTASEQRGIGHGTKIIFAASQYFFSQVTGVKKIFAEIKSNNQVSINAFTKAGYKIKNLDSNTLVSIFEFSKT